MLFKFKVIDGEYNGKIWAMVTMFPSNGEAQGDIRMIYF